jgi:hypothetical protein
MRVVSRTSHIDSRPWAGNAVRGHLSTLAVGQGAKASMKTPRVGWVPSVSDHEIEQLGV